MAQQKDVATDKVVLKNTIKDKKTDKHEAGKDLANLRIKKAINGRKEVRKHRKSIRHQGKHLRRHGVKRPVHDAKSKAKVDKDIKKQQD